MNRTLRVGLSHDLWSGTAETSWGDIGLQTLSAAGARWEFLPADDGTLAPDDIDGFDAVLFAAPAVTSHTVSGHNPPPILARFGVGLDSVDVDACTKAGVAITITPDGARRAVATAALTLTLAARSNLLPKDRIARTQDWSARMGYMGHGLTGITVGTIGLGNIAKELFRLLAPFNTRNLASDPHIPAEAVPAGIELVGIEALLAESDVVVVTAALTPETHHLLNSDRIRLLKTSATIVNVARGPIIDTSALTEALREGRIAGAALDVFEEEPLAYNHPLASMENVILTPHSMAWTDEMALGNGRSAINAILEVHAGRKPPYLVNASVLQNSLFMRRISRSGV